MAIELEIRMREVMVNRPEEEIRPRKFNIAKQVSLVLRFQKSEVDDYFQHFEKTAINLEYPKAMCPMLLQTVLSGKAQRAQPYQ